MSKKVHATILLAPPVSGSADEVRFDATGDCTWVQFTDEETQQHWYGVFGDGDPRGAKTVTTNTNGQAFVIAGGQGYLIDTATRQLLHKTEVDYLVSAIAVPGKDLFLAADVGLFAYSSAGLVWQGSRISVDGITFTGATASQVEGLVDSVTNGQLSFTLQLEGWQYHSEFILPEAMRVR